MIYLNPLKSHIRHVNNNINKSIKAKFYINNTKDITGCNMNALIQQIEDNFQPKMNWNNKVEWRLDYIIPIDQAKTKDEINLLHHYSNLIPVWNYTPKSKTLSYRALSHPLYQDLINLKLINYIKYEEKENKRSAIFQ